MALSLRINIVENNVTKTILFDASSTVFDACRIIREKCNEYDLGKANEYGLFLTADDNKIGVWLEPSRSLEYYMLNNGDILEYTRKMRTLRVKMLDDSVKTILVDDSQIVANLMVVICAKIGITNHDEYSLVFEEEDNIENLDNRNYGTLTLRRKKEERDKDDKMEKLRKTIKTDDEVNWLDPSKTLREQGIDEHVTVLLRRKFFFSDQNIDSRDPVQLNLLYVQAKNAIVDGTHPVTSDKACEFAGIQCQIHFGNYNVAKHKPGLLDLKEFLPQSFIKKGVEKKIFQEHAKHTGLSDLEAKVLYTKLARSLKTYGVTFFLVKEKMKGKNKLVPRLLGVTKDSVLRLDEHTKEMLQCWPLTTVKRWGASPSTFTLDFGDYSDQYFSVQTTEAEQIQQLIAGYIDIILKKKQAKDHLGIDGDEGSTMIEDSVSPHKATILQHETHRSSKVNEVSLAKPAVMRPMEGEKPYGMGHVGNAQQTIVSGSANKAHAPVPIQQTKVTNVLSEPQRALLSTIETTQTKIEESVIELETKAQFPELGTDKQAKKWKQVTLDTRKQNVGSQIAAMNAATAQVVTLTSGPSDEIDHTAVGAAINTIGSNLPEMTKDVRVIAALMDDSNMGDKLLDATRKLVNAFSDLLRAAEPESKVPRQTLLSAASRVGESASQVLATIGDETVESKEVQDTLMALAKAMAHTTAALILSAKNIAHTCEDQQVQNRVIGAATQCALATSQLVACAQVVAPTIHSPACQEQLTTAVREVSKAVENLVAICNDSCGNSDLLNKLHEAAAEVTRTLNDLLNHIKLSGHHRARETIQESSVEKIYATTDKLTAASSSNEMVKQARILGAATAQLIESIKTDAEKQPDNSDIQKRLLAAAKTLADATARMVEAARQCASHPQDISYQDTLRASAEYLRDVTTVATSTPALRAKLVERVNHAARRAVSTATQCIQVAQASYSYNTNQRTQEDLMADAQDLVETIPPLVDSIKTTTEDPQDTNNQVQLMYVAEVFLHPAINFVQSSRSAIPTITDLQVSQQLSSTTQQFDSDIIELRTAMSRAQPVCQGLGLNAASQIIEDLKDELREFERALENFAIKPLPGDSTEKGASKLVASVKLVNQSVAQLLTATSQGNEAYTAQAARDTAQNLRHLTGAVRMIAATIDDKEAQRDLVNAGQEVVGNAAVLVDEARRAISGNEGVTVNMQTAAREVTRSLEKTLACLPGQRDVDVAITCIKEWSHTINSNKFPATQKSYGELQKELGTAANNLNAASSDVVNTAKNPAQLASSAKDFSSAYHELLQVSMELAGQTQDGHTRGQMVHSLTTVSQSSSELLSIAKQFSVDPNMPNGRNQLADAARFVTESINSLLAVYTSATPGQAECDNAMRNIQAMKPILDNPTEPINEWTYYECLDTVTERSKVLGEALQGIAASAKSADHDKFCQNVKTVSGTICCLIEAAAQAAYLVGVSDSSSVAGKPGLVDQAQFARASQAIHKGCSVLTSHTSAQQEVLSAATVIARHTSALCNACRTASSKTTNPVAKRRFVQSARDVANSTSDLVKAIKALDNNYSDDNRRQCRDATKPLLEAVDSLYVYANSSEFVSVPAKISTHARQAQEPVLNAGRRLIDTSCSVINTSKNLVLMSKDPSTWQQFATNSKGFSDSMIKLASSIRDKAPGQADCDKAEQLLGQHLKSIDTAYMDVCTQTLAPRRGVTLPAYNQQVGRSAAELADVVDSIRHAAKFEAEHLGHGINQMVQYFEPLVQGGIGAASNLNNSKQQEILLNQLKSVTESALQLVYTAKDCGGNPKAVKLHPEVDESVNIVKECLSELGSNVETLSMQSGIVQGVVETIFKSMSKLSDNRASLILADSDISYADFHTKMVQCSKDIAKIAGEMATKASTDPQALGQLSIDLQHKYTQLANDSIGAAAASTNIEVSLKLREAVQALGGACVELARSGGECQIRADELALRDIGDASRNVAEKVARVLATLQSGSRGTQACINAASTVSGIIGDLDTTIMFATAGNLNPENEGESFADHRENILKTAKALVEDTKTLVAGAASSQEQLAVAAQNAVTTIVQLAEVVKFGAASLGSDNPDSQIMLINAVKDVASALGDLIQATKAASGKPVNDPAMSHLKDSAKVMVTNVTSLLKTVKAVEDEHTRGTRALEATIEAIGQEMRQLRALDGCKPTVSPEDIIRITKEITKATGKSVSAGISNKQDDIIAAANVSRRVISEMLIITKSASEYLAETLDLKTRTLEAGDDCAKQYRELLIAILQGNSADAKHTLPLISRNIAKSCTELVAVANLLKGSDWVDPEDPTVIAENELLGAAASIDAAARKLAQLRPRKTIKNNELDETLNFDEMILEAAKSITAATSALVKAASAAQRELIDKGKISSTPLSSSDDGQWSEGLISAARLVAAATHNLVESANGLVLGHSSEEKLISSAKQVASSTAQLLVACKVKAEGDTEATRRLQQAGNAVIRSTDNLVMAARQAISSEEERSLVLNKKMVGGLAQELDAQANVLRAERELDEARGMLFAIRQAKYKMKGGDTSGDETDGNISGYDSTSLRFEGPSNNQYTQPPNYDGGYGYIQNVDRTNTNSQRKSTTINLLPEIKPSPFANNYINNNTTSTAFRPQQSMPMSPKYPASSPSYDGGAPGSTATLPIYQTSSPVSPTYSARQQYPATSPSTESVPKYSVTSPTYDGSQKVMSPTYDQGKSFTAASPSYESRTFSPTSGKSFQGSPSPMSPKSEAFSRDNANIYGQIDKSFNTFGKPIAVTTGGSNYPTPEGSYTQSDASTNTYKIPGGYKTVSNKFESFQQSSGPMSYTATEKFYTAPPSQEFYKNGANYQTSAFQQSSQVIGDPISLGQHKITKSTTQQVTERKTVQTMRSTKQESSSKTFRLE